MAFRPNASAFAFADCMAPRPRPPAHTISLSASATRWFFRPNVVSKGLRVSADRFHGRVNEVLTVAPGGSAAFRGSTDASMGKRDWVWILQAGMSLGKLEIAGWHCAALHCGSCRVKGHTSQNRWGSHCGMNCRRDEPTCFIRAIGRNWGNCPTKFKIKFKSQTIKLTRYLGT